MWIIYHPKSETIIASGFDINSDAEFWLTEEIKNNKDPMLLECIIQEYNPEDRP